MESRIGNKSQQPNVFPLCFPEGIYYLVEKAIGNDHSHTKETIVPPKNDAFISPICFADSGFELHSLAAFYRGFRQQKHLSYSLGKMVVWLNIHKAKYVSSYYDAFLVIYIQFVAERVFESDAGDVTGHPFTPIEAVNTSMSNSLVTGEYIDQILHKTCIFFHMFWHQDRSDKLADKLRKCMFVQDIFPTILAFCHHKSERSSVANSKV